MSSKPMRWHPWEERPANPHKSVDEILALFPSYTREQAQDEFDRLNKSKLYVNNFYHVWLTWSDDGSMVWLSIKRNNKSTIRDWRHLQRIKNELVGPECEGVELFPAESRMTDEANQYHLWCLTEPGKRLPFGWNGPRNVSDESEGGAVQRPGVDFTTEGLRNT